MLFPGTNGYSPIRLMWCERVTVGREMRAARAMSRGVGASQALIEALLSVRGGDMRRERE